MGANVLTNLVGVDFDAVYPAISATTPEIPGLPFEIGTHVKATNGREYMFCTVSGAVAQYASVAIDENAKAVACTNALANDASYWGAAQVAFTSGQSGWIALAGLGGLKTLVKDNVAVDAQLYTSTSVGVLGTDASTGDPMMVVGVRTAEAAASGGGATEIIATYPAFKTPAL